MATFETAAKMVNRVYPQSSSMICLGDFLKCLEVATDPEALRRSGGYGYWEWEHKRDTTVFTWSGDQLDYNIMFSQFLAAIYKDGGRVVRTSHMAEDFQWLEVIL